MSPSYLYGQIRNATTKLSGDDIVVLLSYFAFTNSKNRHLYENGYVNFEISNVLLGLRA